MSIVGVDYNKNAIFRQTGKIHKVVVVGYFGVNEEGEEEKKRYISSTQLLMNS